MKKLMMMVMAACAIGFTSCGNKGQQAPADQVEASAEGATVDVASAIEEATAQLTEQIEAKDAPKFQAAIEAVQAKVAEFLKQNPEAAKEYVAKVQEFLKENAESIKAFVGDNEAIQTAVSALTAAPAETIVNGLMSAVDGLNAAGDSAMSAVDAAVEGAKQAAEDKAEEVKDAAKKQAGEAVDAAANEAKKALGL